MKHHSIFLIILSLCIGVFLSGCMSYTTLQSPKTLEPAEVIIGGGVSSPNISGAWIEVNSRVGILKNFDAGIKFAMGSLIFIDGKYQILREPIYVSADLGWSYYSYSGDIGHDKGQTTCFYPMIIAGQDHWYFGVKRVHMSTGGEFELFSNWKYRGSGWLSTNIVAGGIVGEKVRFIPEVNLMVPDGGGKPIIIPAIGLQFIL